MLNISTIFLYRKSQSFLKPCNIVDENLFNTVYAYIFTWFRTVKYKVNAKRDPAISPPCLVIIK